MRALLYPLQLPALFLALTTTLFVTFVNSFANLLGDGSGYIAWTLASPGVFVVTAVVMRYGWLCTRDVAHGHHAAPAAGALTLSPFTQPAFLTLAGVLSVWLWLAVVLDGGTQRLAMAVLGVLFPALTLTVNLIGGTAAFHPASVIGLMGDLGWRFGLIILLHYAWIAVPAVASSAAWPFPLTSVLTIYAYLLTCYLTGRCLYARRAALGLTAEAGVDLQLNEEQRDQLVQIQRLRQEAHRLGSAGRARLAHSYLMEQTQANGMDFAIAAYDSFEAFQFPRILHVWGGALLARCVELRRFGDAWYILTDLVRREAPLAPIMSCAQLQTASNAALQEHAPAARVHRHLDALIGAHLNAPPAPRVAGDPIAPPTAIPDRERPSLLLAQALHRLAGGDPHGADELLVALRRGYPKFARLPVVQQQIDAVGARFRRS